MSDAMVKTTVPIARCFLWEYVGRAADYEAAFRLLTKTKEADSIAHRHF